MASERDSERPHFGKTIVSGPGIFSKEQRDVALAATLLRLGMLNERQLSAALATWTLHGSVPLGEHLIARGLLDEPARHRAEEEALSVLEEHFERIHGGNGSNSRGASIIVKTLEAIDGSGTISKLLGIRDSSSLALEEGREFRQTRTRYKLLRKLGQGGLGRVWLAFDESLKRHVAVKEIATTRDPVAMKRFRREAEITGRLEHPGIVPIYELGEDAQSGEVFYAMRFLGKETLHDSIREYHERKAEGNDDPMLIRGLLTAFVSVCQAIGHAHSRQVIHRDLKPENVAIDSFGQVIVIDWGLAKIIGEVGAGDLLPDSFSNDLDSREGTMEGQVLGTPLYMSPEQAGGRLDELDERTDIYGLGSILYAILTGFAPHEHVKSSLSTIGTRDMLSAIASNPSPTVKSLNPDVDPALAAICERAMARRQYARYQTATQLADDIQRWMAGEPVSAYQEKLSQRITRWVQTHSILSQAMAATLTVIVVSMVTMAIASRQNQQAERQVRFDQMLGKEHEVETRLTSSAEDLAKDARFMSTLPEIQGIINARGEVKTGDSEEVWRNRLDTVFEGLLHANTEYLSVSFVESQSDGKVIARADRHISESAYVRRQTDGRLGAFEHKDLLTSLPALFPGEVLLSIKDEGAARGAVRLVAITPVHNEQTGELFGLVSIETDLAQRVRSIFRSLDLSGATGYLTDTTGKTWVSSDQADGLRGGQDADKLTRKIPVLETFFSEPSRPQLQDRIAGCTAVRIALDRTNPQATVAIVLRLEEPR